MKQMLLLSGGLLGTLIAAGSPAAPLAKPVPYVVPAVMPDTAALFSPDAVRLGGFLGGRVEANTQERLARVDLEPLLAGFRKKPGVHPWIGEHLGKWMHAATLAWMNSGDAALRARLDYAVTELIKAQEPDGYLGTYVPETRFAIYPGADGHEWSGPSWDVWSHKYCLLGLLTYYQYTGEVAALQASRRAADLLLRVFPAERSILAAGTHVGMAATSVLEPMVLLYRFTGDGRYLDFCRYVVGAWDEPAGPGILSSLASGRGVDETANGKAYEMLSNLVGLCDLARVTGDRQYLDPVLHAWEDVVKRRLYVTGSTSQGEHFHGDHELPNVMDRRVAETCVTTTWIQLNQQLLRLTGAARFGAELERTYYNHLAAAQRPDGREWCYFTALEGTKPYGPGINCCVSSGPRGMALAAQQVCCKFRDGSTEVLAINLFDPFEAALHLDGQRVTVRHETGFPRTAGSTFRFTLDRPGRFAVQVRAADWAMPIRFKINGESERAVLRDGWLRLPARTWRTGDHLEMSYSIESRLLTGTHGNSGNGALAWGPFILAYDQAVNQGVAAADAIQLDALAALPAELDPTSGSTLQFASRARLRESQQWVPIRFVPFADAGGAGSEYRIWLPLSASETSGSLDMPLDARVAARGVVAPPGFEVTLFAAEPEVVQPVGMTFDDRGRLWVVELMTYSDLKTNFDLQFHDRIVILEDSDGDGRCDSRKVFWEGHQVTSVAVGFGGVWVLAAPRLLFIPDRDGDDVPDGEPEVLLDGWDAGPVRHNIVNGLKWGPDGWLYGRHGIQATSRVGRPGAAVAERVPLNCCIWRFHPIRREFELVCQGGTNSWGHDWDEQGNLWFINTVIGHLWHGIPGAWYRRMYGEHLAPRRYRLIDQHADHYHWNTGLGWEESRDAAHGADALGGGHAHSGLMIYLGDNWPAPYRNELFTLNFHGRRINHEHLAPRGSGYVGMHRPDLLKFVDPWFRGIDLGYGPDGGVFVLDWSDVGECHENDDDGVHRETGRIFKVTWGEPRRVRDLDLAGLGDAELVELQLHPNAWQARQARRILQERHAAGHSMADAHAALRRLFDGMPALPQKLNALWALHVSGGTSVAYLMSLLDHGETQVRRWAVTLLVEPVPVPLPIAERLTQLAESEPSAPVRLALASALHRLELAERSALAARLLQREEDSNDHNLPLVIWYGIEPALSAGIQPARELYRHCRIPLVRQHIARRIAEDIERAPEELNRLLEWAAHQDASAPREDVVLGFAAALHGWRAAPMPKAWPEFSARLAQEAASPVAEARVQLALLFQDPAVFAEMRRLAEDPAADAGLRQAALNQLLTAAPDDMARALWKWIEDPVLAGSAARGLAQSTAPEDLERVLDHFRLIDAEHQAAVIDQMVARPGSAELLLRAVADGTVTRRQLNALHARQILRHGDPVLEARLSEVWGEIRDSDQDKQRLIERYRQLLTEERLEDADLSEGRRLFNALCAACHRLHGEGKAIGPDLTGSGRGNLEYLLENVVDPAAMLAEDYRVLEVEMADGRSLSGLVVARTERTLELQMQNERVVLDRAGIVDEYQSRLSLMPEGLLEPFNDDEIRDLIGYLMHPHQVELPVADD